MFTVTPIFSKVIYQTTDLYTFTSEEIQYFQNLDIVLKNNVSISENRDILNYKTLNKIKKYIQKNIETYAYEVLEISKEVEFYITESWINYMGKNGHHHEHKHPNSILSGVLFITGGDSPISFSNSESKPFSTLKLQTSNLNLFNSDGYTFKNIEGSLLLFPSDTTHYVELNPHEEVRVSLSFNTFVKGVINRNPTISLNLN